MPNSSRAKKLKKFNKFVETNKKIIAVGSMIVVMFILYGTLKTTTRDGTLYEYVNTPEKVEMRNRVKAAKAQQSAVERRNWRVQNYHPLIVSLQDAANPVVAVGWELNQKNVKIELQSGNSKSWLESMQNVDKDVVIGYIE